MRGAGARGAREQGFALLIVLWSLVLLAFLMTQILAAGRDTLDLAANLRAAAQMGAAEDGAIDVAMFHVSDTGAGRWAAGETQIVVLGGIRMTVDIQSLNGLVNPNLAALPLLASLFQNAGVAAGDAGRLAAAILAWRTPANGAGPGAAALAPYRAAGLAYGPPGLPFADLSELRDVIGMTPAIYALTVPHMSLYQARDPDPAVADDVVRKALAQAGSNGLAAAYGLTGNVDQTPPILRLTACPAAPVASRQCRQAVVSFARAQGATPFTWLARSAAH